jgi:hypothetical protein
LFDCGLALNLYIVREEMPSRCVVYGCSNTSDAANQIALHPIPYYEDSRSEAVKRRQRWVEFVKRRRARWEPTKESRVCSKHFKPEDFVRILTVPGLEERTFPRLKRDEIGISVYPSIQTVVNEKEFSTRDARAIRRKVRKNRYVTVLNIFILIIIKFKNTLK